jgi:pyrroline-5-carboxylate reductase
VLWLSNQVIVSVAADIRPVYAPACVTDAERAMVQSVFEAVGTTEWLVEESMTNALTVISECGPAYCFRFFEALEAAARGLGFDEPTAPRLAVRTLAEGAWFWNVRRQPPPGCAGRRRLHEA